MLEAIERIQQYTAGLDQAALENDQRTVDAVVWNLTVLGEAARHVPDEVTKKYNSIPWPQIRGIRNRVVHGYDQIDYSIVWAVVSSELAPLVPELETVMRQEAD